MIIVSAIMSSVVYNQTQNAFTQTKSNIAVFNSDKGGVLSEGLVEYLSENAKIVAVDNSEESIQDALFYGIIDYVLRIPEGFSEGFMKGDAPELTKNVTASTASGASIDLMINKYLSIADTFRLNTPGADRQYIRDNTALSLQSAADAQMVATREQINTSKLSFYFMFAAYPIMAILIMSVTTIMITFNETDLSKRNACAPVSPLKMNLQLVLGNSILALAVWLIICAYNILIYGRDSLNTGSVLLCVNTLVFTLVSLSIGFIGGRLIKGGAAQSAYTNVIALGISFISGIFVPQEMLGDTVLKIASFTPGYWYVKAVNDISSLPGYSLANLRQAIGFMLIQLGFAAAIFIVALALSKQKKMSNA
jgi:ABC-2 type transport system permease protein